MDKEEKVTTPGNRRIPGMTYNKRGVPPGERAVKITEEMQKIIVQRASEGKLPFEIAKEIGISKPILSARGRKYLNEGYKLREELLLPISGALISATKAVAIDIVSAEQRDQIQKLAGLGLTVTDIAHIVGMSRISLSNHCQEDMEKGRATARQKVTETLYGMATDGEHPAETRFYLKAQAGWKEATQIEFPDEEGKPQNITGSQVNINLGAEKMQTLIALLNEKV